MVLWRIGRRGCLCIHEILSNYVNFVISSRSKKLKFFYVNDTYLHRLNRQFNGHSISTLKQRPLPERVENLKAMTTMTTTTTTTERRFIEKYLR